MSAKETKPSFVKMSGAGNDFFVLDNRDHRYWLTRNDITALCRPQTGVGADGVLAVEPTRKTGHDFRMRYYNADGGEAEMCGNGSRCIARFYHRLVNGKANGRTASYAFETMAGTIRARVDGEWVNVNMTEPTNLRRGVPLKIGGKKFIAYCINTGVPHVVIFVKDVDKTDVVGLGPVIRFHRKFQPDGVNVNFVQVLDSRTISVRTFERGVEKETLACGTGVTAAAIVYSLVHELNPSVSVKVKSGRTLEVNFKNRDGRVSDIILGGPAEFMFEGATSLSTAPNPLSHRQKETYMQTVTTQLPDEQLLALVEKYHTPLYLFEEAVIRDRCRQVKSAITYPNTRIRYACKALTLQAILKIVRDEGLWIDASSKNEVERALKAGFLPSEIYYTGEGAEYSVYAFLVKTGVLINCTSLDQLRLLGKVPGRSVCSIRINPGKGDGANNATNTGGPSSKHGIYKDQVDEAKSIAEAHGIKIIGVHSHIGSGAATVEPWLKIKDITLSIAKTFKDLQFVNLGGGLPVVYDKWTHKPMPVKKWGAALSRGMEKFSEAFGRGIQLQVEPGKFIVAHSGTLLAEVQAVKSTPRYNFAIVNTGLTHNSRPALYGAYHPIRFIQSKAKTSKRRIPYVVAGNLCESGDVFTRKKSGVLEPRLFAQLFVGDVMVMGCVGAYSHAMKSDYNSMNMPMSLLIEESGSARVIERRGTLIDIMRREVEAY